MNPIEKLKARHAKELVELEQKMEILQNFRSEYDPLIVFHSEEYFESYANVILSDYKHSNL
jgi:hypothetical protein